MSVATIIFYILLVDALAANMVAWFGAKWYYKHFRIMSRFFPMTKGWTTYYLVLVGFIGWLVLR